MKSINEKSIQMSYKIAVWKVKNIFQNGKHDSAKRKWFKIWKKVQPLSALLEIFENLYA